MKIKICGLNHPENIRLIERQNPDFMGFIFYKKSSRYIGDKDLMGVLKEINPDIIKTGVFVNEDQSNIEMIISQYGLRAIQLHGSETPELCNNIKKNGLKIIKALGIKDATDFDKTKEYEGCCDYFLFDTKTKKHGGSGESFNWDLLKFYKGDTPFILSGGIGISNIAKIQTIVHSRFAGIDINSRFELAPGIKDIELIKKLLSKIKKSPSKRNSAKKT